MSLSPEKPGVWKNDAWQPGSPGTFAVIIGVTNYRHLDGSPNCFGLGPLYVSALTAYTFFEWLASDYRRTGSPLAKCWLLLAPDANELQKQPSIGSNLLEPTYDACYDAIQEWKDAMAALPAVSAAASRSVFFFSGHGLEVIEDRQILLPSDYLAPRTNIDRALSTQNIARGLKAMGIPPLHFLMVDACRNDHNNLNRFTPLEGTKILDEPANKDTNPDAFVPIFYASAPGLQAMQPNDVLYGLSLFGEALLDGLHGAHGITPDCSSGTCFVDLHILRPFVNNRVAEIAKDRYNQATSQRVRIRGDQTEEPVTEVPAPGVLESFALPPPPPAPLPPASRLILRATTASFGDVHQMFNSEKLTDIWQNSVRVFDLQNRQWLAKGSEIEISNARRAPDTPSFALDLQIPDARRGGTYWVELRDATQKFGFAIPIDSETNPKFLVEIDFDFDPGIIRRLDVTLSIENPDFLGKAALMWRTYDQKSARDAADAFPVLFPDHEAILQDLMYAKMTSPLSAAVAGAILLRARRWDLLHDWLRNLANWFPQIPDGPVLWAEQCLRNPNQPWGMAEALEYTLRLDESSLPLMVDAAGYALRQVEDSLGIYVYSIEVRDKLERIHQRLKPAISMLRTGGLFAVYADPSGQLGPEVVLSSAP